MIKRLRLQFILTTMVLMAVLMAIFLGIICYSTYKQMAKDTRQVLEIAARDLPRQINLSNLKKPKPPIVHDPAIEIDTPYIDPEVMHEHTSFYLFFDENGQLQAGGHPYFDLSDTEKLRDILQESIATGETEGILDHRELHFLQVTSGGRTIYVFADIAGQLDTLHKLVFTCFLIYTTSLAAFWFLSRWLAKRAARPVEQSLARQRQFVDDASHELKTPLTVILTNAEMLQSQEFTPDMHQRLVDGILITATQMRDLTNGLLELAKTDARSIPQKNMVPLDLSELAGNCAMCFEPTYFEADRTLCTHIQPGIYVRGSAQHLHQVVEILLDNGRKYSTPNTQVQLNLEQTRGHCTLRAISQGNPLTAQQCKDIFQRFYRADEARSRDGSFGLGLPIAESIVREHRGRIWAQSKNGINTFTVTLPTCSPEK